MVSITIARPASVSEDRSRTPITSASGTCVEPMTSDEANAAATATHNPSKTTASRRAWLGTLHAPGTLARDDAV